MSSKRLLGGGGLDGAAQLTVSLPCLFDRGQDRGAPLCQFAQVQQAFLQGAQVRVVEVAGRLLAVARDEGHGRPFVEQRDGSGDLLRPDASSWR